MFCKPIQLCIKVVWLQYLYERKQRILIFHVLFKQDVFLLKRTGNNVIQVDVQLIVIICKYQTSSLQKYNLICLVSAFSHLKSAKSAKRNIFIINLSCRFLKILCIWALEQGCNFQGESGDTAPLSILEAKLSSAMVPSSMLKSTYATAHIESVMSTMSMMTVKNKKSVIYFVLSHLQLWLGQDT
jgi:hypothetical protein